MFENDEKLVDINEAKAAIRLVQEKLFEDVIDTKEIFRITNMLNNLMDDMAQNYEFKK